MPGLANLEGTAQTRARRSCGTLIKARHYGAAGPWVVIAIQLILVADPAPASAVPVMHAVSAELRANYLLVNYVYRAGQLLSCLLVLAQPLRLDIKVCAFVVRLGSHLSACASTEEAHCYKCTCLDWLIGVLVEHPIQWAVLW